MATLLETICEDLSSMAFNVQDVIREYSMTLRTLQHKPANMSFHVSRAEEIHVQHSLRKLSLLKPSYGIRIGIMNGIQNPEGYKFSFDRYGSFTALEVIPRGPEHADRLSDVGDYAGIFGIDDKPVVFAVVTGEHHSKYLPQKFSEAGVNRMTEPIRRALGKPVSFVWMAPRDVYEKIVSYQPSTTIDTPTSMTKAEVINGRAINYEYLQFIERGGLFIPMAITRNDLINQCREELIRVGGKEFIKD